MAGDTAKTIALAEGLVGTAAMWAPHTHAESEGFALDCEAFDQVAFICACCDWYCSADEANETSGGELICDECEAEESK